MFFVKSKIKWVENWVNNTLPMRVPIGKYSNARLHLEKNVSSCRVLVFFIVRELSDLIVGVYNHYTIIYQKFKQLS